MTTFDDRENAFENKFAHDEQMTFKAEVRRKTTIEHATKPFGVLNLESSRPRASCCGGCRSKPAGRTQTPSPASSTGSTGSSG